MSTRRSICAAEPHYAHAGEISRWRFTYISSVALPKGTKLKFDLLSKGRSFDWQIPQTSGKGNVIWAEAGEKVVKAKALDVPSQFEFVLPVPLKGGEKFSILMGSTEKDVTKYGNLCQCYTQRKRNFNLYVDPTGKGNYPQEAEVFHIDVRGGELKNIKIIVPSVVSRNRRFDVLVRFEDNFGNLTNLAPEKTLIELSYENLRENLNWKLFVPETGFLTLPNLYFNEPGIYRIQLKNLKNGEVFYSSPIKCFMESDLSLFWGILHGEAEKIDSLDNLEGCLRHFRDEKSLQFFAPSPFESIEETSPEEWKNIMHHVAEFNETDRFVAMLGFQWQGEEKEEGLHEIVFTKDGKPILRRKDAKTSSLKKIYKSFQPKDLISIPSFTMGEGTLFDFANFVPEFERVVEIYNCWGSSECSVKDGNLHPIKKIKRKEEKIGNIREALNANCRFGFVAGGFDSRGAYKAYAESNSPYSAGLTAIIAKDQTREALMEALYNRSCYATTGERILVWFNVAEQPMGSILSSLEKPGLEFNRYISGFVIGTSPLKEVSIIRNGKVFKNIIVKDSDRVELDLDDSEPLSSVVLPSNEQPFAYYYIRVLQKDGHMAWSSPIWVDYHGEKKETKKKKGFFF